MKTNVDALGLAQNGGRARLTRSLKSGRDLDGSRARLPLKRHSVASLPEVRAQDELALEAARLETAVCLGDLIEGDPLGDARLDGARCQQPEEPLQVLPEPGGMSRPHRIDRVETGTLATRQPPPQIQARDQSQIVSMRRCACRPPSSQAQSEPPRFSAANDGDSRPRRCRRRRRRTRPAGRCEVFALVVDRRGAQLPDQRRMLAAGGAHSSSSASLPRASSACPTAPAAP